MRRLCLFTVFLSLFGANLRAVSQQQYPFQNPALSVESRIDNVLSLLTLQEKIGLMGESLNVPRLGIHASGALASPTGSGGQIEGLHGVTLGGPGNWGRKSPGGTGPHGGTSNISTTQYPQAVGLGEMWDPALLQQIAAEEGYEARYIFQTYDRGGLIVRAPNADLARDPRWGRSEESYGEDPFLVGTLATAYVRGLQGNNPQYWQTVSMLKHFMANSNEDNRSGSSSNFDAALMQQYYAAPFRMAIEQGGAGALMASYNAVNGVPMTANPLLKTLVINQWGFDGLIDTDRGAVMYMVTKHKYFPDMEHAVAGAIHAGVNQFLDVYEPSLQDALKSSLITEADINENLRGLLRVMIKLGELDGTGINPYSNIKEGQVPVPWDMQATKDLALHATEESIVLLKNSPVEQVPLLPLDASRLKSIAVIGPFADEVDSDFYGGTPPFAITPLQGIRNKAGSGVDVRYSANHDEAVEMAKRSDIAVVLIGNHPTCSEPFGHCTEPTEGKEAIDRKEINLKTEQQKLVEDVYASNPRTIVVLLSGFPYTIDWAQNHVPAIVHMTNSSEEEGAALANVLFGAYNPAGRLVVTWPRSLIQLPPKMDYNLRDGRTYMYFKQKPLYPFGYGLSYTSFTYSDMRTNANKLKAGAEIMTSIEVTNSGTRSGDEVVQFYVKHLNSAQKRPSEELKGFQRITLAPHEKKTVTFHLPAGSLAYWDEPTKAWKLEADHVQLMIGASSADIKAQHEITVIP